VVGEEDAVAVVLGSVNVIGAVSGGCATAIVDIGDDSEEGVVVIVGVVVVVAVVVVVVAVVVGGGGVAVIDD
jgi:hypothetical protein